MTKRKTSMVSLASGVLLGVAHPAVAAGQLRTAVVSDTALLSAIIRTTVADRRSGEFRVDPRPLNTDDRLYAVVPSAVVAIPDSVLRRRTAVVTGLGLDTVDATRVGQNSECPGLFVGVRTDSVVADSAHRGCPATVGYVLAIGLPRPGSAILANGDVYDRQNMRAQVGYYAVRVILTNVGPGGSSVHASDYVMQNTSGKWLVVKVVGLMYLE